MYVKRIELSNYGPIAELDISLPFADEQPLPVLLVGENGAGKTVLLSHIVNGLLQAQALAHPETPEVETGKVYKVRSSLYIAPNKEYYFGRVDFEQELFTSELHLRSFRKDYQEMLNGISGSRAESLWESMGKDDNSHQDSGFYSSQESQQRVKNIMRERCILYFPADRFEEPAWLNEHNLTAEARRTHVAPYEGYTVRKVIASSPLKSNQDWLYDVIYDRSALEIKTTRVLFRDNADNSVKAATVLEGYVGPATSAVDQAIDLLRIVTRNPQAQFKIGRRNRRTVSISGPESPQVPNIFQLSSGESSLLNLGLSILRDADMSASSVASASDIRGTVVVDEVDLHLHAVHKHEVLPRLIKMFPRVQFIVTTHSPLFALGMQREFGEDGFSLYRLPEGVPVSPEEFSEFGSAYSAFQQSQAFGQDMRNAIREAVKPVVVVEGKTDKAYLERAAELFGKSDVLECLEVMDGGGAGKLKTLWESLCKLPEAMMNKRVLLLLDCDQNKPPDDKGALHRRTIPLVEENPVKTGIENLLPRDVLERAIAEKPAFIDIRDEHKSTIRGAEATIPAEWSVNEDEKTNLCNWICENGTAGDFTGFETILDLIDELMNTEEEST